MNPTRSCRVMKISTTPEFPPWETQSSPVLPLCGDFPRGKKSEEPPRHVPGHRSDANGGTQQAEYPIVAGRTGPVPSKRPARLDGKALLPGPYALHTTFSVIIGRALLKEDVNAYFAPKKTHNLELRFAESRVFRRGRMSKM
jgi:hypothetical protein